MFAWFWPLDFSFSGFLFVGWLMLWLVYQGIAEGAKDIGKVFKNQEVQEGFCAAVRIWLGGGK